MPEAKRPDPSAGRPPDLEGRVRPAGRIDRARHRNRRRRTGPRPPNRLTDESITKAIAVQATSRPSSNRAAVRFVGAACAAFWLPWCVLTLTIAGPVRTYFAQRTEMKQLKATEEQLRAQIAELEQRRSNLPSGVHVAQAANGWVS